jgi:N6-adenosine-specific RNA methylase IME4
MAKKRRRRTAQEIARSRAAQAKKAHRAKRERELGKRQRALPDKRYGVILADPEYQFEPWSRETGMDRAADNHYPTSALDVIKSRDVASIAAEDCILFLWATVPMLPHALVVMSAWGFDYRSHYVWAKDSPGTGYWNRNTHDILLIGTRGSIPAPAPGTQWYSVINAPRGAHSAKPEVFLRMIEEYYPTLLKIELNRRGPARPSWDAWGFEAETEEGERPTHSAAKNGVI